MKAKDNISMANQQRLNQLLKIISQKDQFIKSLLDKLAKKQKHLVSVLSEFESKTRAIPFKVYQKFFHQQSPFILLKVNQTSMKERLPIWLSQNVQLQLITEQHLSQINIKQSEQKEIDYKSTLTNDVSRLKQNLQKCQNMLLSLRQLKHQEDKQKQGEASPNKNLQQRLKVYIDKLQAEIFKDKQEIKQLKVQKCSLNSKIEQLQKQLKGHYSRFENLIIAKNQILNSQHEISEPNAKRKHKKILVNY